MKNKVSLSLLFGDSIGVDEAGRGPWAGPVAVAAVRLDPQRPIDGLNDSKALNEARRNALFPLIQERALAFSIQMISAEEIDRSDILRATFDGMRRAAEAVWVPGATALIDGNLVPPGFPCDAEAVVKGDAKFAEIAAASILAKVARDRYMEELELRFPGYGFAKHKGYGTAAHQKALAELGPCVEHRKSFKPIARLLAEDPGLGSTPPPLLAP